MRLNNFNQYATADKTNLYFLPLLNVVFLMIMTITAWEEHTTGKQRNGSM